jgi:5'-nucleotidase
VEAIVVLIHEGGLNTGGPNECVNLGGRIADIAKRMDPAIDVILSAHTHHAYNCALSGKLVTSSGSYGRFVTQVDIEIDRRTRDIVSARAENRLVNADIAADGALSDLVERYRKLSGPIQRVVGKVTGVISRYPNRDGESRLGQLTADAQLEATRGAGAVAAFMNPGGIRSALPFRNGGDITYADVFTVNPFSNTLLTMTLSGAQILRLLEQQWAGTYWRVLQVSSGVGYAWDDRRAVGQRVVPGSVTIGGKPLEPAADYRITVNNFMAGGGDGFTVLLEGHDRVDGPQNREAFMQYLQAHSPVAPGRERRIARAAY